MTEIYEEWFYFFNYVHAFANVLIYLKLKSPSYYLQEIERIKRVCFSNDVQLRIAKDVKRYMNENYEKDINLDDLASIQKVSKFHLIRIFKKYHGTTPHQYLINKRLIEAKLLLSKGVSVTQACYSVGFESLHSFSTLFKSRLGSSPSEFKKQFSINGITEF